MIIQQNDCNWPRGLTEYSDTGGPSAILAWVRYYWFPNSDIVNVL